MMMLTIVPLSLLLLAGSCRGDGFGYDKDNGLFAGPLTCSDTFPTCKVSRQSLINIETSAVQKKKLLPLESTGKCKLYNMTTVNNGRTGPLTSNHHYPTFNGIGLSPINIETSVVQKKKLMPLILTGKCLHNIIIVNDGHTAMVTSEESSNVLPTVSEGPLGDNVYKFGQLHFHWGKDNSERSGHMINNKRYAMEMHALFYKEKCGSLDNVGNYDDGLTVLGYLFEISSSKQCQSNGTEIIQSIVDALTKVNKPSAKERIMKFPLMNLLFPKDQTYYMYNSAIVNTLSSSGIVNWILFKQPKTVCNSQIPPFRELKSENGYITHNSRPLQPLENRVVMQNIPKSKSCSGQADKKQTSFSLNILGSTCTAIV